MESDGDADKCIYTAEVKTSLYILDKKVKRLVHPGGRCDSCQPGSGLHPAVRGGWRGHVPPAGVYV